MAERNKAWNLTQGDGMQFAKSSFRIRDDEYAKIQVYGACEGDNIILLSIDQAPESCEDLDNIATCFAILKRCNAIITVATSGRYILARETGSDKTDIKALNVSARVTRRTIKPNIRGMCNSL